MAAETAHVISPSAEEAWRPVGHYLHRLSHDLPEQRRLRDHEASQCREQVWTLPAENGQDAQVALWLRLSDTEVSWSLESNRNAPPTRRSWLSRTRVPPRSTAASKSSSRAAVGRSCGAQGPVAPPHASDARNHDAGAGSSSRSRLTLPSPYASARFRGISAADPETLGLFIREAVTKCSRCPTTLSG